MKEFNKLSLLGIFEKSILRLKLRMQRNRVKESIEEVSEEDVNIKFTKTEDGFKHLQDMIVLEMQMSGTSIDERILEENIMRHQSRQASVRELFGEGVTYQYGLIPVKDENGNIKLETRYRYDTPSNRTPTIKERIEVIKAPISSNLTLTRRDFEELNEIYREALLSKEYPKILQETYRQNIVISDNYKENHILIGELSLLFTDPLLFAEWVKKIPEVFPGKYNKNVLFKLAGKSLQSKIKAIEDDPDATMLNGILFAIDNNGNIIPKVLTYKF